MKPLVVDLDNTLLRTDLLAELLPGFLVRNPLALPRAIGWLLAGRARLKDEIALRCAIDPATLPYNEAVLDWLRGEHAKGREIWLVSASHRRFVDEIARHLGLFAGTLGSDATRNLKGEHKREALVERFGEKGFDYAGDSSADLAVWRDANAAIVVGNDDRLAEQAAAVATLERRLPAPRGGLSAWRRAFRLHQWVKNGLVLVPLLTAHLWGDPAAVSAALLAFLAFGFTASTIYVLNDLADLRDDRAHPVKRGRPLASGLLPVPLVLQGAAAFALLAIACSAMLPASFAGWIGVYLLVTTAYSADLKRRPIVDVMCLAGLYTVRLFAGAAAIDVPPSFWLLAFSMFLFLSLALVKRFAELRRLAMEGGGRISRNYQTEDLPVIIAAGVGAGLVAVLVLALYIQSGQTLELYGHPRRIWAACPVLLYWIVHVWFRANRGAVDEDPVSWAAKDPVSWLAVALIAGAFAAAL
ncbi:UbiA family prenyltransferase [Burkholderiaceae bacterium FT117]|uniref:UbiA family prenyltransferase n=1 Tax=Zeimonas sediminis TaxID=2944268 RepID=UPI002342D858|nr:UbiA family prenyltransferase [Zeimonas sediminis]MCM5572001.1 UbiA family prenyltransferase [Zeimonas sediminis]